MSANRHPLLLMLDEFPMLGRLDVLAEALSLIAGYGIRACLVAQDLTQIYAAYGRDEAVTVNCDTTVAFAPNKIETAQALSKLAGETTVRHAHRTVSSAGTSVSEPEVGRPLITPDEVRRLGANEVLIFTRGHPRFGPNGCSITSRISSSAAPRSRCRKPVIALLLWRPLKRSRSKSRAHWLKRRRPARPMRSIALANGNGIAPKIPAEPEPRGHRPSGGAGRSGFCISRLAVRRRKTQAKSKEKRHETQDRSLRKR